MQPADVPARTWLLGGAAAWALLAWALALAGMGAHAPPLADDPALLQRLPQPRAAAPAALGPPGQYAAVSGRPLFSENRQPKPFFVQGEGEAAPTQAFDYVLTSVLIAGPTRLAILQSPDGAQSLRVKLGESHESQPAWRLSALSPRSATFEGPDGQRTLELRVFDGQGGQQPTPAGPGLAAPNAGGDAGPGNVEPVRNAPPRMSTGTPPVQLANPVPPPAPVPPGGTEAPLTEAAQMEAIRQRIEARRAQLRRQAQTPPPPTVPAQ